MRRSVAILEDDPTRIAAMRHCLNRLLPTFEQRVFDDAAEMIAWLEQHLPEVALISLDHDLPFFRNLDGSTTDCGTGARSSTTSAPPPRPAR